MDFSIASFTPEKSPFSISSDTSLVLSMTSTAGTRPPSTVRTKRCDTIAFKADAKSPSMVGRTSTG
ncbi:hypothetical protein D3C72_2260570 [compost metagenome]